MNLLRIIRDDTKRSELHERERAIHRLMSHVAILEDELQRERSAARHRIARLTEERDEARADRERVIDAAAVIATAAPWDGISHGPEDA